MEVHIAAALVEADIADMATVVVAAADVAVGA